MFFVGDIVRIINIESSKHLIGKTARIESYDNQLGKWRIRIQNYPGVALLLDKFLELESEPERLNYYQTIPTDRL